MQSLKILYLICLYRVIVAAVSYLNTIPFLWGIQQAIDDVMSLTHGCDSIELRLEVPSMCAKLCADGEVDVALVPIGALSEIKNYKIITDFCLSADGEVDTVALLTNQANLANVETVYLDKHSRTSVELAKILAKHKWGIEPKYVDGIPCQVSDNEAIVAIGDKVFEIQKRFKFKKDLALEWKQMTGLPFVFAVWVACTDKGLANIDYLNAALENGVNNIEAAIAKYAPNNGYAPKYLTENIKYRISSQKMQAISLFWDYVNPG